MCKVSKESIKVTLPIGARNISVIRVDVKLKLNYM